MFNLVKETKGNIIEIRLMGVINESVDFDKLIGAPPAPPSELHVYCKNVQRLNSIGVKSWMKYFQQVQLKGTKIKFFECSFAMVEQMNMISNFNCGGEIDSIFVPFLCSNSACKKDLAALLKTSEIKQMRKKVPNLKCPNCKSDAVFDDIAEEYFMFLAP